MNSQHLEWQQLHCTGDLPCGRMGETMTTAEDQSSVFMYGGLVEAPQSEYFDDFFVFNPEQAQWARKPLVDVDGQSTCEARAFHSTVTHRGKLFVFGGYGSSGKFNDVFTVDPATGSREVLVPSSDSEVPAPRYCHSAVVFEDAMYVFGGKFGGKNSTSRLADIHKFTFNNHRWTHVDQGGDIPPPLSAHTAVVCGRRMFVFGGRHSDRPGCCGDMYEFAFDTCMWRRTTSTPEVPIERARHSAVVHNGVIAVFGGWNGKKKLNDLYLHALDGSDRKTVTEEDTVDAPSRRECHVAVMWKNTMIVFSGRFRVNMLDDVQALQLGPRTLVEQCRDWLASNNVELDENALPERLLRRLTAWKDLHSSTSSSAPTTPLLR